MLRSFGYLRYDPKNLETKYKDWWIILKCDEGLSAYYRHWVEKEWPFEVSSKDWLEKAEVESEVQVAWPMTQRGVKLTKSVWGTHVSVVRGEEPQDKRLWKKYENRKIHFEYDPEYLNTNTKHWWIRVFSPELESLRLELGLTPTPMAFNPRQNSWNPSPFHITIGHRT